MPTCPLEDKIHIGLRKFGLIGLHIAAHGALYIHAGEGGEEPCARGK